MNNAARLSQCEGGRLENSVGGVMRIARANEIDVYRQSPLHRRGSPKFLDQTRAKVRANYRFRHSGHEFKVRAPGKIDHEAGQCLVERRVGVAITGDAGTIADRDTKGLPEDNADI